MNGSTHHKNDTPTRNGILSDTLAAEKEGEKATPAYLSGKPVRQRPSHKGTKESTKFENSGQETLGVGVCQLHREALKDAK